MTDLKVSAQALPTVEEIRRGQDELRAAGDELTNRVRQFEAFLAQLPGRIPASCYLYWHGPDGESSEMLALNKDGKDWALCLYSYTDESNDQDGLSNYRLLRDASVEDKALAVASFPKLLSAIRDRQKSLIDRARKATDEFDRFAAEVGVRKADR